MTAKIAVLGGGSFGTVIANILAENGHAVNLWLRDRELVEIINTRHENPVYHPGYKLGELIHASASLGQVLKQAELVYLSIPGKAFRTVLQQARQFMPEQATLVSTTKGIEAGTFKLMSQIIADEFHGHPCGVMSGPNLAGEIARHQLTASVIASKDEAVCKRVQNTLACGYFRLYGSTDVCGVELGGVLKNIYAIMAGMASAMGLGQNTVSMLMTRSLAEMSRFAVHFGADPITFLGLSGVGDLFVTCTSPLSRNFRIGFELGKGVSLDDAVKQVGQIAEGVNTLSQIKLKADELGVSMPLATSLHRILFEGSGIEREVASLMERESANDVEFSLRAD
ncbi:MAG: NAD(P)H-dependent glycerol-3-phosphate dehydrogenase [Pseudomonadales bacterium]|nr:NAD(P)H-dependent glycerol-3-phosphate dehydrogenase [Pseudomonadales bacterium]